MRLITHYFLVGTVLFIAALLLPACSIVSPYFTTNSSPLGPGGGSSPGGGNNPPARLSLTNVGGFDTGVTGAIPLTDGSQNLLVFGTLTHFGTTPVGLLAELKPDGSLNTSFGSTGAGFENSLSPTLNALAVDTGHRIWAGGLINGYNSVLCAPYFMVLNPTGTECDPSFSQQGTDGYLYSISLLTDGTGRGYLGGSFTNYGISPASKIARINSDGTFDSTFTVGTGFTGGDVTQTLIMNDASNRVYVAGTFTQYQGSPVNTLVRLNSDGSYDYTFNTGTGFDNSNGNWQLAQATDGTHRLYVSGAFTTYNGTSVPILIRLQSDGTLDGTFSADATSFYSGIGYPAISALLIDPQGSNRIYAGYSQSFYALTGGGMARLNSDGSIDSTFVQGSGFDAAVTSISSAADGSGDIFVTGGFGSYNGTAQNAVARLHSNGSLVTSFYQGGAGFNNSVYSALISETGQYYYVSGNFTNYNGTNTSYFTRLNKDGSLDEHFNTGTNFDYPPAGLTLASNPGQILAWGAFNNYQGTYQPGIVRINSDGSLDISFQGTIPSPGADTGVFAVAYVDDGSGTLYAGGSFSQCDGQSVNNICRLQPDGSYDTGFVVGSGFDNNVNALLLSPDGSHEVYIGGDFTHYKGSAQTRLIRLTPTGTKDASFSVGSGFDGTVASLIPALDGSNRIYVGGNFAHYNGTAVDRIARLNPNGSLDTTFAAGTSTGTSGTLVLSNATDGSGKIYATGGATYFTGANSICILRFNSDGTLDSTFNGVTSCPNPQHYNPAFTLPLTDGTGRLLVGGSLPFLNSTPIGNLVILNSDGSIAP
jgi:uncharacterized delta-60 repeat protein